MEQQMSKKFKLITMALLILAAIVGFSAFNLKTKSFLAQADANNINDPLGRIVFDDIEYEDDIEDYDYFHIMYDYEVRS